MTKAKIDLNEFWEQNDGKQIKSYGKWLIAYGIIVALACAFWLLYLIGQTRDYELTGLGIAVIFFYIACICSAIYYIYAGRGIVKGLFTPNKIQGASTAVISLVIITAICQLLLTIQLGGTVTIVLGLLDIITITDSVRYKKNLHKAYLDFCNGETKASKRTSNENKEESSEDKKDVEDKSDDEDEYDDGL